MESQTLFENRCGHAKSSYAGEIEFNGIKFDLYLYCNGPRDQMWFCLRFGSDKNDCANGLVADMDADFLRKLEREAKKVSKETQKDLIGPHRYLYEHSDGKEYRTVK